MGEILPFESYKRRKENAPVSESLSAEELEALAEPDDEIDKNKDDLSIDMENVRDINNILKRLSGKKGIDNLDEMRILRQQRANAQAQSSALSKEELVELLSTAQEEDIQKDPLFYEAILSRAVRDKLIPEDYVDN